MGTFALSRVALVCLSIDIDVVLPSLFLTSISRVSSLVTVPMIRKCSCASSGAPATTTAAKSRHQTTYRFIVNPPISLVVDRNDVERADLPRLASADHRELVGGGVEPRGRHLDGHGLPARILPVPAVNAGKRCREAAV